MDCSLPGSSVPGILQAGILEWVAISFSRGSSRPRDQTCISCMGRQILNQWATWEAHPQPLTACALSITRSCPALCDPVVCSPPGSSDHGVLQAWILEWIDISFSRGSYWPRNRTLISFLAGRFFTRWATWKVRNSLFFLVPFYVNIYGQRESARHVSSPFLTLPLSKPDGWQLLIPESFGSQRLHPNSSNHGANFSPQ